MKTKLTKSQSLTTVLRSGFFLLILFVYINADAQIAPASNIRGPLKAHANGSNLIITSEVQSDVPTPIISYSFLTNTSGASIVSKGPIQYNASTGVAVQTIEVNPGTEKGAFTLKLNTTTPGGTAQSSKSVTVVK